jgi:RecJ-like exonuclease
MTTQGFNTNGLENTHGSGEKQAEPKPEVKCPACNDTGTLKEWYTSGEVYGEKWICRKCDLNKGVSFEECCDNRGEKMNKRHNDYLCDSCSPQYAFLYHDTLDKLTALTAEHEAEKTELEKKLEVMEAEYEKLKEVREYIMQVSTTTEEGKEIVDNVFEKSGGL